MILLDMDGVCADFVGSACRLHGKDPETATSWNFFEDWGITEDEFWAPINAGGREFWANLDAYPWFSDLVSQIMFYDPDFYVCTKPSLDPACMAGKLDWLQQHFGRNFRRYIFTPDKWILAMPSQRRVLVDDSNSNCDEFYVAGGDYILVPQPWNRNRSLVPMRMDHVSTGLEHYCTKANYEQVR